MKIGICGANLGKDILPGDIPFIGVDRGIEKLLSRGITPEWAIGDLDSIDNADVLKKIKEIRTLPVRKDVTDTHAALEWAIDMGYDDISIYGATGGRLDHFIAALCLLELHREVNITILDPLNEITLLTPGIHRFCADGYEYFSLFALDKAVITITGSEYDVADFVLLRKNPLGCSNQVKGEFTTVKTDADVLLIRSKDGHGAS